MRFSVARTPDEAELYLDLNPCQTCESIDTAWDSGLVSIDGELVNRYAGVCSGCHTEREFVFGLPERETMPEGYPTFGGSEPSQLLDAGEWLWVSDLTASNVPTEDPVEARQALAIATAAVDEVMKFIPTGGDDVPNTAFWSERGAAVRTAEPGRFRRERLLIVRDTYRELATQ